MLSAKNVLQYSVEGRCQLRAMQIVKLSFRVIYFFHKKDYFDASG